MVIRNWKSMKPTVSKFASKPVGLAQAALLLGAATMAVPASACMTVDDMVGIYPVMEERPKKSDGFLGKVYKIRATGERAGNPQKLWPNYYVVEVLSGKYKGRKFGIPAHVTSCHSIVIPDGAEGYVVGSIQWKDRDGNRLDLPIMATGWNGKRRGFTLTPPK